MAFKLPKPGNAAVPIVQPHIAPNVPPRAQNIQRPMQNAIEVISNGVAASGTIQADQEQQRRRSADTRSLGDASTSRTIQNNMTQLSMPGLQWQPDIHAHNYVPVWIRAINESAALEIWCTPLQTTDFARYVSSFSGRQFLQPMLPQPLPDAKEEVPITISRSPGNLSLSTYYQYFDECLKAELKAHMDETVQFNLYNVELYPEDVSRHLYRLRIPGMRENAPRIELGDVVMLRQVLHGPQMAQQMAHWAGPAGGKQFGLCAPAFAGHHYLAVVWGLSRSQEIVVLRIDNFLAVSRLCNVLFSPQKTRYGSLWRGISTIHEELQHVRKLSRTGTPMGNGSLNQRRSESGIRKPQQGEFQVNEASPGLHAPSQWLRRILFPTEADGSLQKSLPKGVFSHKWVDAQLNYEQMVCQFAQKD